MLGSKILNPVYKKVQLSRLCTLTRQEKNSDIKDVEFEKEFMKNHVKIDPFQKALLAIGSSLISLWNPARGDMIACLGEVTGEKSAKYIKEKMEESEEGSRILKDRPRILSKTVDLAKLKKYPAGTLGKAYSTFLEVNNVTPDARDPVKFMDDIHLAYVIQRYRDVHDLFHTLLGMPTNMLGEVTVKWVEAIQTKLPMCVGGAIFGAGRLRPKQRELYKTYYLPWAIETGHNSNFLMNIYFEKRWDQQVSEIHKEFKINEFKGPKTKKLNKNYLS